jgi:hypothetical protein
MAAQNLSSVDPAEESMNVLKSPVLSTAPTIQDLRNTHSLWYKIHVFVYDLRNFKVRADCQSRLDSIVDASYLGTPYFKQEEVDMLKATKVNGEMTLEAAIRNTLNERLERRMKKRVESGDYRVCAAHDLAPIFETAFNIKPKDLAKDNVFLSLLENSGLKLKNGENWLGLSKKPNIKQGQKKKKKGGK